MFAASFGGETAQGAGGHCDNVVDGPPVNITPPVVSGVPAVGSTLTVSNGQWLDCSGVAPGWFSYQWYRDGAEIAGATWSSYQVRSEDEEHTLHANVTAYSGGGETTQPSNEVVVAETPGEEDSTEAPLDGDADAAEPADPDPVDSDDPDAPDDDGSGLGFAALEGSSTTWPVTWNQNRNMIIFRNADGLWTIFKRCYDDVKAGDLKWTVGPGYIATFRRGSVRYVDDYHGRPRVARRVDGSGQRQHEVGGLNDVEGGLGTFGWHHARGIAGAMNAGQDPVTAGEDPVDPAERPYPGESIEGRMCATKNASYGVHGRSYSGPVRATETDAQGRTKRLVKYTFDVYLREGPGQTGYGINGQSIARVRYRYSFYRSSVRAWISVLLYPRKTINSTVPFVKEPKLSAVVHGGDFTRIAGFGGPDGATWLRGVMEGKPNCLYTDPACNLSTDHTADDTRKRVRWDFGTTTNHDPSQPEGEGASGCSSSRPCFNVVMRSYRTTAGGDIARSGEARNWEGAALGLDSWSVRTVDNGRAKSYVRDTFGAGPISECGAPAAGDEDRDGDVDDRDRAIKSEEANPKLNSLRRWEHGGWKNGGNPNDPKNPTPYDQSMTLFTGWTGGRGPSDCEPLQRAFATNAESYGAFAVYSLGDGWVLSP